ncbi:hypothetical protein CERSUDRAFT_92616 [Gelatoporia subvermispora B]|uniref:Uncharacterized protein n=1 Tax=Ceriporiopsis subvermispora (strain B) TaxID=914234 RepID=M2PTR3_CERS8|nr:hypothetical protein CERSUDRAFT_92616 [Gelatoporia subvermispora B]
MPRSQLRGHPPVPDTVLGTHWYASSPLCTIAYVYIVALPPPLSVTAPTDTETAQYLHAAVLGSSQYSTSDFKKALEDARLQPALGFEGRVLHALAALGLR